MTSQGFNHWLLAIEEAWEEPFDYSKHDHDHLVSLSPDWPPPDLLDQALYRILRDRYASKLGRLAAAYRKRGYAPREAHLLAKELFSRSKYYKLTQAQRCA